VLLVGDGDRFPVRYTKTDRKDANAFDTAFYPMDLYYAALYKQDGSFDDWDNNNNGYYGELHGETHTGSINIDLVNLVPIVAVGRVPASTLEEVNRYVQKVIRYENSEDRSWAANALLAATHDWQFDACHVMERIARNVLKRFQVTLLFSAGSPCDGAGNLTPGAITSALNRGVGLFGYIGHGDVGSLATGNGYWDAPEVAQLTNSKELAVMLVAACSTAMFATLPPYSAYTDINGNNHVGTVGGEVFNARPPQPACLQRWSDPDNDLATLLTVRTDAGAVAYLGGVTGIQMYEPVEYLLQGLVSHPTLGEAWQWMVAHFYNVQGVPGTLSQPDWFAVARMHHPWKYMLFGDPSLKVMRPPESPLHRQYDLSESYWRTLYGLIDDSPGAVINIITGKIKPIPPVYRDILKHVLIDEIARTLPTTAGLRIRKVVLESAIRTFQNEVDEVKEMIEASTRTSGDKEA